jgi:hypothetical protein
VVALGAMLTGWLSYYDRPNAIVGSREVRDEEAPAFDAAQKQRTTEVQIAESIGDCSMS